MCKPAGKQQVSLELFCNTCTLFYVLHKACMLPEWKPEVSQKILSLSLSMIIPRIKSYKRKAKRYEANRKGWREGGRKGER